ncbi:MAG: MATE family efflux transporter [Bacteroidales bacterium]|nr:MATE family efflux transporter [Bacteroidales bacterium]
MKDLTTGREGRLIFFFALPMLFGNLFQQMYSMVDSAIVGKFLGKEALAAVGASFPIIFTMIALMIGIASGGMVVISQYFGAKDMDKVKRAIQTLYIFMLIGSVVLTSAGLLLVEPIFRLTKLPPELLPLARTYLNIYVSGIILFFGFNGTAAILRGLGDSKTPLYFLILSTLSNIGLDLLFVLVFKWGIAGAAYATIISQGGALVLAMIYLHRTHEIISFDFRNWKFDTEIFKASFRIGLPTGLQQTFVALGMMALFSIVNTFGTNVVAAFSAAGRIDSIATVPAMVFAQALSTFVGQNIGAGKIERVQKGLIMTLVMSWLTSILITALLIIFRSYIMHIFTNESETEVIRIGGEYLTIVTSFYLVFATMFTFAGVMRGAGDTLIPMFITLFALWLIRIPMAYFLSGRIGEAGIWWAVPIGWTAGMIMSFLYYRTGRWKKKTVVKVPVP